MRIAICGGGTGGHLYPLLALAEELESHDHIHLHFYLSLKAGLELSLCDAGTLHMAELRGWERKTFSPGNLKFLGGIWGAFCRFRRAMKKERPAVAIGFGSYASLPGMLAALSLGVPTLIHEQNVVPGAANRLLSHLVKGVALAFPESERWLGGKGTRVVGNPVRKLVLAPVSRREAASFFGLEEAPFTFAVVGGSQGAESLNRALLEALPRFKGEKVQVIHAVGRDKFVEHMRRTESLEMEPEVVYRPLAFIERMDLLYGMVDLIVCRAGASTLAEITAVGIPAILVPYPFAAGGHQEANARVLEKRGAARVVKDNLLSGEKLYREVSELMRDREGRRAMAEAARRSGDPESTRKLAQYLLEIAEKGR